MSDVCFTVLEIDVYCVIGLCSPLAMGLDAAI